MEICIHKSVFGNGKHLISDGDNFQWSKDIPSASVIIGDVDSMYSANAVCELFHIEPSELIGDSIKNSLLELGIDPNTAPAAKVQRSDEFKIRLNEAIKNTRMATDRLQRSGYMDTFFMCQGILRGMTECTADYNRIRSVLASSGSKLNQTLLRSLSPDDTGFLKPAVYSNTGTTTGRMTVASGPQLLTAPKEVRSCIKSRHPGGYVIQIDYVSLEPRLGRMLAGFEPEKDVYTDFGNKTGMELERAQIKKVLLCAIYGAGRRTLSALLPPNINPAKLIKEARKYLGFDEVVARKREELKEFGFMQNSFGRPVTPSATRDTVIYNNWLQSSAADAALLGFKAIIEKLHDSGFITAPIFLIHDAMLLDVPRGELDRLQKELGTEIAIPDVGSFPFEYSTIS